MTKAQLGSVLQPVLATDVLLASDGNPTGRYLAQDAGLSHDTINLSAGTRVKGAVHVQNVNAYHGRLKQWVNRLSTCGSHKSRSSGPQAAVIQIEENKRLTAMKNTKADLSSAASPILAGKCQRPVALLSVK
jgi:hypothetical protein